MDKVNDIEIRNALANRLSEWTKQGNALEREFKFPSFMAAIDFVNKVAEIAEDSNHHPDITINYDTVKLVLSSHDAGGITRRDLSLAGRINDSIPRAA